jgi:hypothetical protein
MVVSFGIIGVKCITRNENFTPKQNKITGTQTSFQIALVNLHLVLTSRLLMKERSKVKVYNCGFSNKNK